MRGTWKKRGFIVGLATIVAATALALAVIPAGAATKITAHGAVHCTATGKVKTSAKLSSTPNPKLKLTLSVALACSAGDTGNSAITVTSGKLTSTIGPVTGSCTTTNFGRGTATVSWKASGGGVNQSKFKWDTTTATDGTNVVFDLAGPDGPPKGKPGSYAGEDVKAHLVGQATPGGMCSGAFKGVALAAGSTFDMTPPNPNNLPIKHVLVFMQENRSADHYLNQLNSQGQPDFEAEPTTGNPDPTNALNPPIVPFHQSAYCEVADLDHSWNGTHKEYDSGLMDGFTNENVTGADPTGSRAMGYYDQTDLPYYYGLDNTFSTGDRYFSSVLSQTFPNRLYLLAGTSFGHIRNDVFGSSQKSIFELLDTRSISWRIYSSSAPTSYGSNFFTYVQNRALGHVFGTAQYYADLASNNLPDVAFIDPVQGGSPKTENDEHPPANIQVGQKFASDIMNGLMNSSSWSSSAMFFTYDEHGGFYDHVAPPAAVAPDAIPPKLLPGDVPGAFDRLGIRVPVTVISPYSKPHHVSHVVDDHTSILSFIEYRFGLPPLTNRDAAADPMLDHFDFSTPALATPPSLPAAVVDPVKLAAC